MRKETLNCISFSAETGGDGRSNARRDLRLEVLDLRQRLKRSEDAASRHAMMLREGDHRIKNSLQIVASLMTLQANREPAVPFVMRSVVRRRGFVRSAESTMRCKARLAPTLSILARC